MYLAHEYEKRESEMYVVFELFYGLIREASRQNIFIDVQSSKCTIDQTEYFITDRVP